MALLSGCGVRAIRSMNDDARFFSAEFGSVPTWVGNVVRQIRPHCNHIIKGLLYDGQYGKKLSKYIKA